MKALIRFSRGDVNSSLETSKYIENLEKALSFEGINVTNNLLDRAKIAHFISPYEEMQINDAYLEDLIVVISVGYCEGDEKHRFFDYSNETKPTLTTKSKRILKQADLILVPSQIVKEYLIDNGVEVRIEIVTTGVDVTSYETMDEILSTSFIKYFQHKKERPYVLSHGRPESSAISSLISMSNALPNIDFYYLVDDTTLPGSISAARKITPKNCPKNLKISHIVPADIFISGMKGALAYVSLPLPPSDLIAILEALASKTQVIYMDENKRHGEFLNRENVLIAANVEKAERLIWSLYNDNKKTTISGGYKFAQANSLEIMGKQLKKAYDSLIK